MLIIRALTVPVVLALSIACGGDRGGNTKAGEPRSTNPDTMAQQPDNTPDGMGARRGGGDRDFASKAMAGSMAEIQLAQLAQQKATSPGVKELAQRIQQDHQKASQELQSITQQQNVGTTGGADSHTMEEAQKALQRLQKLSGTEFDKAYVDLMVDDHKKDIDEFESAARDTQGAVQQFAQKTLPVLKEHLQLAQAQKDASKGR